MTLWGMLLSENNSLGNGNGSPCVLFFQTNTWFYKLLCKHQFNGPVCCCFHPANERWWKIEIMILTKWLVFAYKEEKCQLVRELIRKYWILNSIWCLFKILGQDWCKYWTYTDKWQIKLFMLLIWFGFTYPLTEYFIFCLSTFILWWNISVLWEWSFHDDSTPIYRAHGFTEWFEEDENDATHICWSWQSADLNPFVYLWKVLEWCVR